MDPQKTVTEWDAQGKPILSTPSPSSVTEWDAQGKPLTSTLVKASPSGPKDSATPWVSHDPLAMLSQWAGDHATKWLSDPENRPAQGAMAGGLAGAEIGAAVGGPAAWATGPIGGIIGAGIGGFGGAKVRGDSTGDAAVEGAKQGLIQGATGLGAAALSAAKPLLENAGIRMMTGTLKPVLREAQDTAAWQTAGRQAPALRELSKDALNIPGMTLGAKTDASMALATELNAKLSSVLAGSTATVPRAQVEQALFDSTTGMAQGAKYRPGDVQSAYDFISQKVAAMPNDVPVAELNKLKSDLRAGIGSFGPGTSNTADTTLRKSVSGAAAEGVRSADPQAAEVMDQMRTNIPLSEALDRAQSNAVRRDVLPMATNIASAGVHPSAAALGMIQRGGVPISQAIYNTSQAIPATIGAFGSTAVPAATRAAVLELLSPSHAVTLPDTPKPSVPPVQPTPTGSTKDELLAEGARLNAEMATTKDPDRKAVLMQKLNVIRDQVNRMR